MASNISQLVGSENRKFYQFFVIELFCFCVDILFAKLSKYFVFRKRIVSVPLIV